MSDLILWKNQELRKIKQDMEELLTCFMRDFSHPFYHDILASGPRIATFENESSFVVKLDIPDLRTQSLEVTLINHDLIIQGEQFRSHQASSQKFSTRVTLPGPVQEEDVTATYREGTLVITLPWKTSPRARKIQVTIPS